VLGLYFTPLLFLLQPKEEMSQPTARLAQLTQLSCKIFNNVYNPTCARTGNKILRQRLIGSSLTQYNPQKLIHFRDIKALYPQLGLVDLDEKERLDEIARRKRRGKGAPKKGKFFFFFF
jgi:small subunit ribosomal protein S33